jgi:hypothetical protein
MTRKCTLMLWRLQVAYLEMKKGQRCHAGRFRKEGYAPAIEI